MLIEHDKHGRMHVTHLSEEQAKAGWRVFEEKTVVKPAPTSAEDYFRQKRQYNKRVQ